jgi:hypothetical protein
MTSPLPHVPWFALAALWLCGAARADVVTDLTLLRNRCLAFAAGHAPADPNVLTIRHGLWAQSPFSPEGEVDLAASGYALACLPPAVEAGLLTRSQGLSIATAASARIREMIRKSAQAVTEGDIAAYGYRGFLYHYPVWNPAAQEFHGPPGTEVSSVDTAILLLGLTAAARYFGEPVITDLAAARADLDWNAWQDQTTPGHLHQFRMSYTPAGGFANWWDWWTHEALLVIACAGSCDPDLDLRAAWDAFTRDWVAYESPAPDAKRFACFATWNGDPFTVFIAAAFLGLERFPPDFHGTDWFEQSRVAYHAHVEFFARELGFLNTTSTAFVIGGSGPVAHPKSSPDPVSPTNIAMVYAIAGGLPYYPAASAANPLAATLSRFVRTTPGFFRWTGWPAAGVTATVAPHPVASDLIIGQDICLTGLVIDNHLRQGMVPDLMFSDPDLARALAVIFPARPVGLDLSGTVPRFSWRGIPGSSADLEWSPDLASWQPAGPLGFSATGLAAVDLPPGPRRGFHRLRDSSGP